jgi:hypothetical protein
MGKYVGKLDNSTGGNQLYLLLIEDHALDVRSFPIWQRTNDQQSNNGYFSHRYRLEGELRREAEIHPRYPDCSDIWAEFDIDEKGRVSNVDLG